MRATRKYVAAASVLTIFGLVGGLPSSFAQSNSDNQDQLRADLAKRKSNLEEAEKLKSMLDDGQKLIEQSQKRYEEQQRELPVYYFFNKADWLNGKTPYELFTEYFEKQGMSGFLLVDRDDLNNSLILDPQKNDRLMIYRNVKTSREICSVEISYYDQGSGGDLVLLSCPDSKVSFHIVNKGGYRSVDGDATYLGAVVEPLAVSVPSPWYKFW